MSGCPPVESFVCHRTRPERPVEDFERWLDIDPLKKAVLKLHRTRPPRCLFFPLGTNSSLPPWASGLPQVKVLQERCCAVPWTVKGCVGYRRSLEGAIRSKLGTCMPMERYRALVCCYRALDLGLVIEALVVNAMSSVASTASHSSTVYRRGLSMWQIT